MQGQVRRALVTGDGARQLAIVEQLAHESALARAAIGPDRDQPTAPRLATAHHEVERVVRERGARNDALARADTVGGRQAPDDLGAVRLPRSEQVQAMLDPAYLRGEIVGDAISASWPSPRSCHQESALPPS